MANSYEHTLSIYGKAKYKFPKQLKPVFNGLLPLYY